MARILDDSPANIECLIQALLADRLVAVPTETVYGLAANAFSRTACERIYAVKGRPFTDPLIVHLSDLEALDQVAFRDDRLAAIADAFWPGPLTVILKKRACVPGIVTSGRDTIAVRLPAHPVFRTLASSARIPLAAPSANPFGYISPTTSAHVDAQLGDRIDLILEGGPCRVGIESTILDLSGPGHPRLLRPGAITIDQIRSVVGHLDPAMETAPPGPETPAPAPGLFDRHYSPNTPFHLRNRVFDAEALEALPSTVAALCFRQPARATEREQSHIHWLTQSGDPAQAARRLFSILRELDAAGYDSIEAEPAPENGIGLAINDRLRRAGGKP